MKDLFEFCAGLVFIAAIFLAFAASGMAIEKQFAQSCRCGASCECDGCGGK